MDGGPGVGRTTGEARPGSPIGARQGRREGRYGAGEEADGRKRRGRRGQRTWEQRWKSRTDPIAEIASAEARGEPSAYYERWLRSFERLLVDKGLVTREELDERTEEFEFGERDDVF